MATEHQEQMTLIQWMSTVAFQGKRLSDWIVMIPNESLLSFIAPGGRRYAYWTKLLKMGFRRGASDLMLPIPSGEYHGLWIEMKRRRDAYPGKAELGRSMRPEQVDFLQQMASVGYRAASCYGWEEGRVLIRDYLEAELPSTA